MNPNWDRWLTNFSFGQLFMWIWANNDLIWLPMGLVSDSEQCSNGLISLLVNFSYKVGQIGTDDLPISVLVNFSCEFGQIMTRYDCLWAWWAILSNVRTDWCHFWSTSHINSDQIWLSTGSISTNFNLPNCHVKWGQEARQMILSNIWTDSQVSLMLFLVKLSYELGIIMIKYDFLEARWVILRNVFSSTCTSIIYSY